MHQMAHEMGFLGPFGPFVPFSPYRGALKGFKKRLHISIRALVRQSIGPSVGPSIRLCGNRLKNGQK